MKLLSLILFTSLAAHASLTEPGLTSRDLASRLFQRIAGVPLSLSDPRRVEIEKAVDENRWEDAARVASFDENFTNVTVRHWASPLGRQSEDPYGPLQDFDVMVMGTVRDDRDFREILHGDFTYVGPDKIDQLGLEFGSIYYKALEKLNPHRLLRRREPQAPGRAESAGVLTSDGWASEHLNDGTNRRPVAFAFQEFLCTPIDQLADGAVPDFRVRRDVDRAPGGVPGTYQQTCRRCHAGMDALAGAYANFRMDEAFLPIPGSPNGFYRVFKMAKDDRIVQRMNKNGDVYPQGYVTVSDGWMNLWTSGQNASLGWRGESSGRGIQALGRMLSQTEAFSRCQVRKVFTQMCLRPPTERDENDLRALTQDFEANGFRLRRVFERTAVLPQCLGEKGAPR